MKKTRSILGALAIASLMLTGCGAENTINRVDANHITGLDYRVIMGKEKYSPEFREFFVKNKITYNKDYMRIKTKRGTDIIEEINFTSACPAEYMPYGANRLLDKALTKKMFGEPDFVLGNSFAYENLQLGIEFSSSENRVIDIGVVSEEKMAEIKARQ